MGVDDSTSVWTSSNGASQSAKTAGQTITAAHFSAMLDIVDSMTSHGHDFTDDYNTNCECQCQRGSL
jgi:hypothetical protein